MNRTGSALIAALWVVVALGALVLIGSRGTQLYIRASINREYLLRASWAARACLAVQRARFSSSGTIESVGAMDLGRGTRCHTRVVDPSTRIDLNRADSTTLVRLLGDTVAAAAILDWRDADSEPRSAGAEDSWYQDHDRRGPRNAAFASINEVRYVRGFDGSLPDGIKVLLTVDGEGVDPNRAPERVMAALSAVSATGAQSLIAWRRKGGRFTDAGDVVSVMSVEGSSMDADGYLTLQSQLAFNSPRRVVEVTGTVDVDDRSFVSSFEATVELVGDRLALLRIKPR